MRIDHLRHFLLSTSLEYFGSWGAAVNLDFPGTPTLQRKELWLTGALSRVLHERGVQTPAKDVAQSKILMNKGTIVLGCKYRSTKNGVLLLTLMVTQARSVDGDREKPAPTKRISTKPVRYYLRRVQSVCLLHLRSRELGRALENRYVSWSAPTKLS